MNRLLTVSVSLTLILLPLLCYANPQDGTVAAGQAVISESGTKLDVHQSTDKAVIDWRSFDIQAGEHTEFHQPSASSLTLNRVNNVNPSQIMGQMSANGNVVLVNPNGVFFGGTSRVDVNGIVASTANIGNNDFMTGNLRFNQPGNPHGAIVNQGIINAKELGLVGLVAPSVENNGIIRARLGKVTLASGDSFTLDMNGDNLIQVEVKGELGGQIAQNRGRIDAEGGVVNLTAAAARNAVNGVVSNSGMINANAIGRKNGKIYLYAVGSNAVDDNIAVSKGVKSGTSTALNSGTLTAKGEQGGTVKVLGDHVGLTNGSRIDVSGTNGGGEAYIGGDYQGKGTTPTAVRTIIQSDTITNADATTNGKGGKVIVWADDRTDFNGTISARGGTQSGDGGFIETSGKNLLSVGGHADASSSHGKAGEWLLDPNNVTIQTAGPDTNVDASFTTTDDNAIITVASIEAALNAGTNVTVTTSTAGANTQSGDITVANSIAKTAGGDATLSLIAHNTITISGVSITSNSGKLNLVLNADSDANSAGNIYINSATITTNNGNLTMGGGAGAAASAWGIAARKYGIQVQGSTITAGTGNITMRGHGHNNAGANQIWGVYIHSSTISATTGNILVDATGGNGTTSNWGLFMRANSTLSTTTGNLTVTALGGAAGTTAAYTGNYGIYLYSDTARITSAGGNITVTGTGAAAYSSNHGMGINTGSVISNSNGGNIIVRGYGGASTSDDNDGIALYNTGAIQNTGAGTTLVEGWGGNTGTSGNSNMGIYNAGTISATGSGNLTINGYGGTGIVNNYGIWNNGTISTLGANLIITTTSGVGTWGNYGFWNSSTISSTTGNMTITGTGSADGTNSSNYGAYNGGTITTTSGNLVFAGTGGVGVSSNIGAYNAGTLTTTTGNLTFTGTGKGSGSANYGAYNSGTFSTTSGNILFTGTGAAGTSDNYGAYTGTISTTGGNITINGTGGNGSGANNYGTYIAGNIANTGAGTISITSSGKNAAIDLIVSGARTIGSGSASGAVTLVQDTATWGGAIINTSASTWFKPLTLSTTIGVAGGAGSLGITSAVLTAMLRSSDIIIGDTAGTGLVTVNAYTWARPLTLQTATGGITFDGVTDMGANSLLARTYGLSDITLNAASSITTSAAGNALILASGRNFINNSNGSALTTSVGRSLVYSTSPASDTLGGIARPTKRYNKTFAAYAPGAVTETGNVFLYSIAPTITVTANGNIKYVGNENPDLNASYSGFIDGDTAASAMTGNPSIITTATAASGVGTYTIAVTAGTLASEMGYQFAYVNGSLSVIAAAVTTPVVTDDPVVVVAPVITTPVVTVSTEEETPVVTIASVITAATTPSVTETLRGSEGLRTAIAAIESTKHVVAPLAVLESRLEKPKVSSSKRIIDFDIITISPELQAKLNLPSLITDLTVEPLIEN